MKLIFTASIMLASYCSFGQVKTKIFDSSIPAKMAPAGVQATQAKKILPSAEFKRLSQQIDSKAPIAYKNKFATPVKVNINLLKEGKITESKTHTTYSLTITAEEALNISAQFNQFHLSPGAVLSIFTQSELTDSITYKENNVSDTWQTRVYQGNQLTFFLKIPTSEKGKTILSIDEIRFGYKKFGPDYFGNSGTSANCNINVVCAQGVGWENERNSVAMIVSGGQESGTGALVMNTCGTNIPYLLTANHVLDANVANWVFQFQTWSSVCQLPNTGWREDIQFNGCQLRANEANSDFALVQLDQTPTANSGITYSGWNRGNVAATTATGIHHPMGDLMKISHELDPVAAVAFQGGAADHWQAVFDQGIVQHGSSGSPLYDQNHRIVGQLHGNQNNGCGVGDNTCFCAQVPVGEYGRFDISWTGGGTNATRLSNWLDASNSGATTTNTTNISNLPAPSNSISISGDNFICSGNKFYTVSNVPPGSTIQWSTSNGYASVSGSGATGTVTMNPAAHGPVTLTATAVVNGCVVSNVATKVIAVGTPYAGFNIVAHPMSPTDCYEPWAINSLQATLAFGEGYTGMQWGYIYNGIDNPGSETWDTYTFIPQDPGSYEIYVRPTNSCGAGTPTSTRIIEVGGSCGGCCMRLQVSPNPAKGILYVTVTDEDQKTTRQSTGAYQVTLREVISGRTVKQWKLNGNQKQLALTLTGVKKGNYMLTVQKGTNKQSKQVIIVE